MSSFHIAHANTVPEDQLMQFFYDAYAPRMEKVQFLQAHHTWLYRDRANLILAVHTESGAIAGQAAAVPMQMALGQDCIDMHWWMDLVVLSQFRRQGVQGLINDYITALDDIKLAGTKRLSADIFRKFGYQDTEMGSHMHRILRPMDTKRAYFKGLLGPVVRLNALWQTLRARPDLRRLANYTPQASRPAPEVTPETLAEVFQRGYSGDYLTNYRHADFLRWRYFEAPARAEHRFFLAGDPPDVALVVRQVADSTPREERVLDIFGALENPARVADLLTLALREAYRAGAAEMKTVVTLPALAEVLIGLGFEHQFPRILSWHTASERLPIATLPHHWMLGDTDNEQVG